jgi:hypothetical protein
MSARVTVITPSLPEREAWRAECRATVAAQAAQAIAVPHLFALDHERAGVAAMLNQLWPRVETDWLLVLDDDDLLDEDYLLTVAPHLADADVVYTHCRVSGWQHPAALNRPFDAAALRQGNYIPATALIHRDLVAALDGWQEHPLARGLEDWHFWLRALDAGARFRCVPEPKWTYRFHGSNLSLLPFEERQ